MRYRLCYRTDRWNGKTFQNDSVEKVLRLPWLWLARLIVLVMSKHWFQGGSVVDTKTGFVRFTWALTSNIASDGRVHIFENETRRR